MISGDHRDEDRSVEKRQDDERAGVEVVADAHILRQGEIPFCLVHVVMLKAECRQAIISRKEQLRLVNFLCDLKGFLVILTG